MKNTKELLNWRELNLRLGLSKFTIRKNKIPKKRKEKIDALLKAMDEVLKEW